MQSTRDSVQLIILIIMIIWWIVTYILWKYYSPRRKQQILTGTKHRMWIHLIAYSCHPISYFFPISSCILLKSIWFSLLTAYIIIIVCSAILARAKWIQAMELETKLALRSRVLTSKANSISTLSTTIVQPWDKQFSRLVFKYSTKLSQQMLWLTYLCLIIIPLIVGIISFLSYLYWEKVDFSLGTMECRADLSKKTGLLIVVCALMAIFFTGWIVWPIKDTVYVRVQLLLIGVLLLLAIALSFTSFFHVLYLGFLESGISTFVIQTATAFISYLLTRRPKNVSERVGETTPSVLDLFVTDDQEDQGISGSKTSVIKPPSQLALFGTFLCREFAGENLMFLKKVRKWIIDVQDPKWVRHKDFTIRRACSLIRKYIDPKSSMCVNLPAIMRTDTLKAFDEFMTFYQPEFTTHNSTQTSQELKMLPLFEMEESESEQMPDDEEERQPSIEEHKVEDVVVLSTVSEGRLSDPGSTSMRELPSPSVAIEMMSFPSSPSSSTRLSMITCSLTKSGENELAKKLSQKFQACFDEIVALLDNDPYRRFNRLVEK